MVGLYEGGEIVVAVDLDELAVLQQAAIARMATGRVVPLLYTVVCLAECLGLRLTLSWQYR